MKYMNMFVYTILLTALITCLLSCSKALEPVEVPYVAANESSSVQTITVSEIMLREIHDSIAILELSYHSNTTLSIGARRELKLDIDENKKQLVELAQVYIDTKALHVQKMESELSRFNSGGASETGITKAELALHTAKKDHLKAKALVYELTEGIIGDMDSSNGNSQSSNTLSSSSAVNGAIEESSFSAHIESSISRENSSSIIFPTQSSMSIEPSSSLSESSAPYSSKTTGSSSSIVQSSSSIVQSSSSIIQSSSQTLATHTLTINPVIGGTLVGAASRILTEGIAKKVVVTLASGYSFAGWKTISGPGSVAFSNEFSATTNVTITGGDVVIAPSFKNDTIRPSIPKNITVTQGATNNTTLNLSWTASSDNKGVVGYKVYINDVVYASPSKTSLTIATKDLGFSKIHVKAIDAAGNKSLKSKTIYHIELEDADRNEYITFKGTGYKYAGGLNEKNERLYFDKRTLKAGKYKMKIRYADAISNTINEFQLIWSEPSSAFIDKIMTQEYTGGWEKWTMLSTGTFTLQGGTGTIRFQFIGKDFNTDWVELIEQ